MFRYGEQLTRVDLCFLHRPEKMTAEQLHVNHGDHPGETRLIIRITSAHGLIQKNFIHYPEAHYRQT